MIKIVVGMLVVMCVFLAAEVIYFYFILSKNYSPEKSGCIFILPEAKERIIEGTRLAREGFAPNFTIIGQDSPKLRAWAEKFGIQGSINQIISGKSRSTFEDTLNIAKITKEHGFGSILIVTSTYHLPRTSFLLRTLIANPSFMVNLYGISSDSVSALDQKQSPSDRKMIFNEMIKFWGSVVELCVYKSTGNLISDIPTYIRIKKFVSSWILF